MTEHLHQVYLMTPDLEASISFYEGTLGLSKSEEGSRSVELETGECALKIEKDFEEDTLAAFGMEPPGESRGDGAVIVIEVDDVEATHQRAVDAGADVLMEPTEVSWDRKMFLVRSPAGYVFEVSRPI